MKIGELCIRKRLEGSDRGVIKVLSRRLPVGAFVPQPRFEPTTLPMQV
jgi:hypothetical protein